MKRILHKIIDADVRSILALLISIGCFTIVIIMMFHPIPSENKDLVNIAIGALLTGGLAGVIGFYFGAVKNDSSSNNNQTTQTMNKTVFWDILSLSHTVVSINGVQAPSGLTVQSLPSYNSSFSIGPDNGNVNVLMHDTLTSVSLVLNNGQSNYTSVSTTCDWAGTRPVRPPR